MIRQAFRMLAAAALLSTGAAQTTIAQTGPAQVGDAQVGAAQVGATPAAVRTTDINMVVALDRSESVDIDERTAQAESLAAALTDPRFIAAVRAGWLGRIGIAVMTWSSFNRTQVVVPWTVIAGDNDAAGIVAILRDYQASGGDVEHRPQTDIALALGVGAGLLASAPFQAPKQILNVISDGIDNFGREAFVDRDEALAHGITINGLVHARGAAIPIVERFFERQVIGGPYAFVLSTPTPDSFTTAMLRKMLLEIAAAGRSSRPDGSGSMKPPAPRPMRG